MIRVGEEDFSLDEVVSSLRRMEAGAIVVFLGIVKGFREGEEIKEMLVEAHKDVAEEELRKLRDEALRKFDVMNATIIHRVGRLKPSDNIVVVAASARNRGDAFKACSWLIDELKVRVPVWKKEFTPAGSRWVREGDRFE